MPRPTINTMLDLSDRVGKRNLLTQIGAMQGLYEVKVEPRRVTRSNAQNAYLWAVVYPAVRLGIAEAWGEELTVDEVHLLMRDRFLTRPVVNRKTGEVVQSIPGSTAALSTAEFSRYIDEIVKFAGDMLNVEIPPADPFHARPAPEFATPNLGTECF